MQESEILIYCLWAAVRSLSSTVSKLAMGLKKQAAHTGLQCVKQYADYNLGTGS